ncbi:hypothetical protein B0I33_106189 [Prauserella shujinwangii]|uniref:Htaa protein n=1 Tax=Prauserella shujinwangii TaxID=1453103 RepID=A0A2T0LTN1_9PSEU|nr:hypothetical protein [Prauserella shujinwangii]PRX47090.1 hypothetical protein B0I33_106189 [Prauserella shujinwangii]
MTRLATKLAAGTAALALAAVPGAAAAQDSAVDAVDEATGPVAYANAAALSVGENGSGGSVISETQRSPLRPGESRLAQDRVTVPGTRSERSATGGNYEVHLGNHARTGSNPFPDGVPSRTHRIVAELAADHVPRASAEANYALWDTRSGRTVLVLEGARTSAECPAPGELTGTATADRLRVRQGGGLQEVALPTGDEPVRREIPELSFPRGDHSGTATVTISRIESFDELLRQQQWRSGDVTVAAGWKIEVVTQPVAGDTGPAERTDTTDTTEGTGDAGDAGDAGNTEGAATGTSQNRTATTESTETTGSSEPADATGPAPKAVTPAAEPVTTTIVLGGVSCSLPSDFVPVDSGGGSGPAPTVPVKIPAGAAPAQDDSVAWGLGLLGGGVLLGAAAVTVALRRRVPAGD